MSISLSRTARRVSLWASQIAHEGSDRPKVLAAHMRAIAWNTATAADRGLFQAPFRAGIRLDPYQVLPLSKALKLPIANTSRPCALCQPLMDVADFERAIAPNPMALFKRNVASAVLLGHVQFLPNDLFTSEFPAHRQ
jgi:hypothetical protein